MRAMEAPTPRPDGDLRVGSRVVVRHRLDAPGPPVRGHPDRRRRAACRLRRGRSSSCSPAGARCGCRGRSSPPPRRSLPRRLGAARPTGRCRSRPSSGSWSAPGRRWRPSGWGTGCCGRPAGSPTARTRSSPRAAPASRCRPLWTPWSAGMPGAAFPPTSPWPVRSASTWRATRSVRRPCARGYVPRVATLALTAPTRLVAGAETAARAESRPQDSGHREPSHRGSTGWRSARSSPTSGSPPTARTARSTPVAARAILTGSPAQVFGTARDEHGGVVGIGRLAVSARLGRCRRDVGGAARRGAEDIASALLVALARSAEDRGAASLHLQADADNADALAFYARAWLRAPPRLRQPHPALTRAVPSARLGVGAGDVVLGAVGRRVLLGLDDLAVLLEDAPHVDREARNRSLGDALRPVVDDLLRLGDVPARRSSWPARRTSSSRRSSP